jgi:hypothetical protein
MDIDAAFVEFLGEKLVALDRAETAAANATAALHDKQAEIRRLEIEVGNLSDLLDMLDVVFCTRCGEAERGGLIDKQGRCEACQPEQIRVNPRCPTCERPL